MFLGTNVGLRVGEALGVGEVLLLAHPAAQTVAVSSRATIITKKCFRILEPPLGYECRALTYSFASVRLQASDDHDKLAYRTPVLLWQSPRCTLVRVSRASENTQ